MVVIDLHETYTVGPFVALADRLSGWLEPLRRSPRLDSIADRLARIADIVAESWTVRTIAVLLEPPSDGNDP